MTRFCRFGWLRYGRILVLLFSSRTTVVQNIDVQTGTLTIHPRVAVWFEVNLRRMFSWPRWHKNESPCFVAEAAFPVLPFVRATAQYAKRVGGIGVTINRVTFGTR